MAQILSPELQYCFDVRTERRLEENERERVMLSCDEARWPGCSIYQAINLLELSSRQFCRICIASRRARRSHCCDFGRQTDSL